MENEPPKHRRIYTALRHDILIGKYESAERFPSEGTLMRRFGVSRITIRQALADLKADGFLETRTGSGTYLSALARHATGMIGLVIPDYSASAFFRELADELVRAGKARGYTMLLGELPGTTPGERAHEAIALAQEYARRKVAGVIIEPIELMPDSADLTREIISAFDALKIPVLLIDRDISPFESSDHDVIGIDNLTAGFVLGKHLISAGARRIGFLLPPHSGSTALERMLGVAGAVIDAGLGWSDRNIFCIPTDDTRALAKALSGKRPPDALVCNNDATAEKVPRGIRVAGFDCLPTTRRRKFTSVRQPLDSLAKTAIATLLERIGHPDTPPRKILLGATLVQHPAKVMGSLT